MKDQWSLESIAADSTHLDFKISKRSCRIGRGKVNDLVIANRRLRRVHAVISRDIPGQLRPTDENSTNGTFVNRQRIEGYGLLSENDVIHFSCAEFKPSLTQDKHRAKEAFDLSHVAPRIAGNTLFVNAHPKETFSKNFFTSLAQLRKTSPDLNTVVEIHESALTDVEKLRDLASRLAQPGIRFAYADFASGHARLLELTDVPSHFVKFDMSPVHGVRNARERKQQVVRDLVRMPLAAGSVLLAEGIEDEEETQICTQMGFQPIKTYHTGRPIPADSL